METATLGQLLRENIDSKVIDGRIEKPKRHRTSPNVNQRAFELCPDKFTTKDFADRAGCVELPARKYLLRIAGLGRVKEIAVNLWLKLNEEPSLTKRQLLEDDVETITKALNLITVLLDENRWLKAEVERWAGIAKQAKVYFNERRDEG